MRDILAPREHLIAVFEEGSPAHCCCGASVATTDMVAHAELVFSLADRGDA